jgi:DNA polymerase-3 subunit epsilon
VFSLFKPKTKPFEQTHYLVIDLEMTGLNPLEDSIISAGYVSIKHGRIQLTSAEHQYFKPTSMMGDDVLQSAHIHLITDTQREQEGVELEQWLQELSTRLKADAWVFHHAVIDHAFLKTASERLRQPLPKVQVVDTMIIEREKHADQLLESHAQLNLNACRSRYGLPLYRQHHALSDAIATAELWLAQNRRVSD